MTQAEQGGCPASLEGPITLEEGQVWELAVGSRLEPSLLLCRYDDTKASMPASYWRCLALESGELFSATTRRWDPDNYHHSARQLDGDLPLVGRRLL